MSTIAQLNERIDQLETQLLLKDIETIKQAEKKLNSDLDKRKNMVSIFGRIAQLQNLLELSIADSTPESIDQLARAIRPMVEQIAPAMEKLNQNRFHAEAGKLEVLVQNEKRITELCSLHKINFEKSEAIGKNTAILLAHYNAVIDNLSRDFALLEAQIQEYEDRNSE